jgi:hypothetical protein
VSATVGVIGHRRLVGVQGFVQRSRGGSTVVVFALSLSSHVTSLFSKSQVKLRSRIASDSPAQPARRADGTTWYSCLRQHKQSMTFVVYEQARKLPQYACSRETNETHDLRRRVLAHDQNRVSR